MACSLLLITDSKSPIIPAEYSYLSNRSIFILSLGIPYEISDYQIIDLSLYSEKAIQVVSEFCCNDFSNLYAEYFSGYKSYLHYFFESRSHLWWFSDISEKSVYRGNLITRIYYLQLIKLVINDLNPQFISFNLNDKQLQRFLCKSPNELFNFSTYISTSFNFFIRSSISLASLVFDYLIYSIFLSSLSKSILPDGRLCFFSFFNWLKVSSGGVLKDPFFGNLPEYLNQKGGKFIFLSWFTFTSFKSFFSSYSCLRSNHLVSRPYFLHQHTRLSDFKDLLFLYFFLFRRFLLFKIPPLFSCDSYDISYLFYLDFAASLSNREFYRNILISNAMSRTPINSSHKFLYRLEFQPFERALTYSLFDRCPSFGFQHSSIGKTFFSHRFSSSSYSLLIKHNLSALLPTFIATTSLCARQIFSDDGFPNKRLSVVGPIRYQNLINYLSLHSARLSSASFLHDKDPSSIFVPVSFNRDEALSLAFFISSSFSVDSNLTLYLKPHPSVDHSTEFTDILLSNCPNLSITVISNSSELYNVLSICSAMIYSGSSIVFEAIAFKVFPILVYNPSVLSYANSQSLEILSSILLVTHPQDLFIAVSSVVNGDYDISLYCHRWKMSLLQMLSLDITSSDSLTHIDSNSLLVELLSL